MDRLHKVLPLFEVAAGTIIVVVAIVVQPPSDTWLYLGFATLALVPLVHVVVANMHAETLMRELARVKAHDLDDLDKRIEKLRELAKQVKTAADPPSPPVQRSMSLTEFAGALFEVISQLESAMSTPRAKSSSAGQPSGGNSSSTGQPSGAARASTAQPLTGKDQPHG